MPRWLWLALLVLGGLLWWAMSGGTPAAMADAPGGAAFGCPRPPAFVDPAEPLQSPVPSGLGPQASSASTRAGSASAAACHSRMAGNANSVSM